MRLLAILLLLPGGLAAQTFEPPEGCEGYLTVQQRGCVVSNHYICEADPEGDQWRVDFTDQGPVYAARINSESEWIESLSLRSGEIRRLEDDPADAASFSELMEDGVDTYDFVTVTDDGMRRRWVGADRLRGSVVEIDGVTLEVMDFDSTASDPESGEELFRGTGVNYVNPEWRLFLPGPQSTVFPDDQVLDDDNSPVDFIFPGDAGFFAQSPIYDCGATTAGYRQ